MNRKDKAMATSAAGSAKVTLTVHLIPSIWQTTGDHPTKERELLIENYHDKRNGCHTFRIKCKKRLGGMLKRLAPELNLREVQDARLGTDHCVLQADFCGKDWESAYCHFKTTLSRRFLLCINYAPFHCA